MTTDILEIPVDRLVVDPKIQPRVHGIREQHVKQLLEALAVGELPPIVVTPHPDGRRYIVIDGAHRLMAYRRAGRKVVPVRVLDEAGYWQSFTLNRLNGLPISVQDRKACAAWLKRNRPELSIREIAREVGLAPSTVQAALQDDRRRNTGGGVVRSTNVWRAFFSALTRLWERNQDDPDSFVERLAHDLADLVERSSNPGVLWDALAAFADAVHEAWRLTDELYAEFEDEKAAGS
jgi:hypothetical protein